MDDPVDYVFVTIVPKGAADADAIRDVVLTEGLPLDDQTQFAGSEAFETAVKFAREAVARLAEVARKLLDADRIGEITIEHRGSKVTLRGIPADRARTADELAEHILRQLQP